MSGNDRYDGWIVTFKQFPVAVVEGGREAAEAFMNGQIRSTNTEVNLWGVFNTPVPIIKPYARVKATEGEIPYFRVNTGVGVGEGAMGG